MARSIYRWVAFLALPGAIWAAFEMYILTLSGPQMLFFSIAHTLVPLALLVFLSFPLGIVWMVQSVAGVLSPNYAERLQLPKDVLVFFAGVTLLQTAALIGYDEWANSSARLVVCVAGIVMACLCVSKSWRHLRKQTS